ncbi:MAG TPA: hypothetical protein VLW84_12630 [Terriglobales bacterium]|nr:hypothetical protein [Terriglobales bacterium]
MCFCASLPAQEVAHDESGMTMEDTSMPAMNMRRSSMPEMAGMSMREPSVGGDPAFHAGSGTAWQPASVPEPMWMTERGGWQLMAHGQIFLTYNQQGGPRGVGKAESVNFAMLMEQHKLGRGTLLLRQMFSGESLTSPHPGFPELFQTGETYHGQPLVDHQHPHDVFSEFSLLYSVPLNEKVSWLVYGGPAAEPALGPVAFMHRASASENPAAPLSHHEQDSTHTSFGVVTTGFVIDRFKLEGSVFNGHEPDEQRWSIQLGPLHSWSARASFVPGRNWMAQYSYGRLEKPEALEPGNQQRQTASVEYNRPLLHGMLGGGNWATTLVWGRVQKGFESFPLNSYLLESTLNFRHKNYAYTRFELVDKDELFPDDSFPDNPFPGEHDHAYRIGAHTFGGVRDLIHNHVWQLGLGGDVTFYSKPSLLDAAYGNNPVSFHIFLRMRPGSGGHGH